MATKVRATTILKKNKGYGLGFICPAKKKIFEIWKHNGRFYLLSKSNLQTSSKALNSTMEFFTLAHEDKNNKIYLTGSKIKENIEKIFEEVA